MRPVAEIELAAALDLGELAVADLGEIGLAHASETDDVLVANDDRASAVDHRAGGKLRLVGHTDLSYEHEIERCAKCSGDFGGDWHAAARQRQYDRLILPVTGQSLGKLLSGVGAVAEGHGVLR